MLGKALLSGALCVALVAVGTADARRTDPAALLAKYAPFLELYSVDRKPSAIEPFLAGANLERLSGSAWRLVRRSPPASALANGSTRLRLDTRGCSPAVNLDSCYPRRATTPTFYGRMWTAPTNSAGVAAVLQYWFFYPLDDWRNPVRNPTLWHMHEGDWEEVSVALDAGGQPLAVAASQHDLGVRRPWSGVGVRNGTHPVVYVALGSHANYFSPHGVGGGAHMIPPRFSGLPFPEPDHTAAQSSVPRATVVDLSAATQPWLSFAGAWGDGSFILLGQRTKHGTVYTHLRVGSSPTGPAFHDTWRNPLLQFQAWPADDGH